jgi:hypothetical protein
LSGQLNRHEASRMGDKLCLFHFTPTNRLGGF